MSKTTIQQVPEAVATDSKLQHTEVEQEQIISELEERLVQEAVTAIEETKRAIAAIEKNDNEAAVKAIEQAVGELDIILARDPDLALLPTDFGISVVNIGLEDHKLIREIRHEIKSAINFGYLSVARRLLNSIASEIQVMVTNLPLASYPDALKEAAKLMDEGKSEAAKEVLELALSTVVLEEEYLPIPILKARGLIEDASTESDKERAMQLLADARNQLKLSQELGYEEADVEYDELKQELKKLEWQINTGENSHHRFRDLKAKVTNFFLRISKAKK